MKCTSGLLLWSSLYDLEVKHFYAFRILSHVYTWGKSLRLSLSSSDWIPSGLAVMVSYGPEYFKSFALCCRGVVEGSVMKQKCTESQRYGLPGRGLTPVSHILIWQFSLPSPTWACFCCMIYDFREMCTRNEHWKLQRTRLSRKNL